MGETLEANGLPDLDETTDKLKMDNEEYFPTIDLYFNDDHIEI